LILNTGGEEKGAAAKDVLFSFDFNIYIVYLFSSVKIYRIFKFPNVY